MPGPNQTMKRFHDEFDFSFIHDDLPSRFDTLRQLVEMRATRNDDISEWASIFSAGLDDDLVGQIKVKKPKAAAPQERIEPALGKRKIIL